MNFLTHSTSTKIAVAKTRNFLFGNPDPDVLVAFLHFFYFALYSVLNNGDVQRNKSSRKRTVVLDVLWSVAGARS